MTITHEQLRQLLNYEPETGVFTWRVTRNGRARKGSAAGRVHPQGYVHITLFNRTYSAHRLAWFYVHGEWPAGDLDHSNRVRHDNRIENLRLATRSQNAANRSIQSSSTTGVKGVRWHKRDKRWEARIEIGGHRKHLGQFTRIEDAAEAYRVAAKQHFGDFARAE